MYIVRCVLMRWTQCDHARCCSFFICESIGKHILVTLDNVTLSHGWYLAKIASRESGMVMTDVIHDRGCYYDGYLSKMSQLIFPPLLCYLYNSLWNIISNTQLWWNSLWNIFVSPSNKLVASAWYLTQSRTFIRETLLSYRLLHNISPLSSSPSIRSNCACLI